MVISQGDIYWIDLSEPEGSEPGYSHPHVIIQNNIFNQSALNTTIVCALTSNLKRADIPGNILLDPNEGNLSKQSVVLITQIFTIDKRQLGNYIGSLSPRRIRQILESLKFITEPHEPPR